MNWFRCATLTVVWLGLISGGGSSGQATGLPAPAVFRVTQTVVNANLEPFSATIGAFGNTLFRAGSGFEPIVYRDQFLATASAADRVIARPEDIAHWDTLRDGALDGAEVSVYRIESGRFALVREDRIADGGFAASGWWPVLPDNRILAPDSPHHAYRWAGYHRADAPDYFTVRAIDRLGRCSPPALAVRAQRPVVRVRQLADAPATSAVGLINLINFKTSGCDRSAGVSSSLPAPHGLKAVVAADGTLSLAWQPLHSPDLAGYVLFRADAPPDRQRGFYLQLAGRAASAREQVQAGDRIVLRKTFHSASRLRGHSNRVWNAASENRVFMPDLVDFFPDEDDRQTWSLQPHPAITPVQDAGETFLQVRLAERARQTIGAYNHAGTGQDWYAVLEPKPYRVEVWLRRHGMGSVRFSLTGIYGKGAHAVPAIEFRPTETWQKFTAQFTPPVIQRDAQPGSMRLELTGPGTFDVDNFRVYRADTPFLDYGEAEYAALARSGMAALRTHAFVKTRRRTYDLAQLTNPGGVISAGTGLNTLPQTLAMLRRAGVRPWLQVEPHFTPAEWRGLVEYLAAPYDPAIDSPQGKPWAFKRFAQGQRAPWTDVFPIIDLELGNETWNRLFRPWNFVPMKDAVTGVAYSAGEVYGLFQEHVLAILRSSPYWQAAGLDGKVRLQLGGQAGARFGREAAKASPGAAALLVGGYNGGWDEGKGPPEETPASYFGLLNHVSETAIPQATQHRDEVARLNASRGGRMRSGTYEAGPGYAHQGLNGARVSPTEAMQQERVMKSLASGTATLDAFLARVYLGMTTQNYFTFGAGPRWTSHAKWYKGGQAYPAWKMLALFNREVAGGDLLRTETLTVPMADLGVGTRGKPVRNAPLVAVYAIRGRDRLSVFVVSRRVPGYPDPAGEGFTPVSLALPFKSAGKVTVYRMSGQYNSHNVDAEAVRVERRELPAGAYGPRFELNAATGADARGLPPASTCLYVFERIQWP